MVLFLGMRPYIGELYLNMKLKICMSGDLALTGAEHIIHILLNTWIQVL